MEICRKSLERRTWHDGCKLRQVDATFETKRTSGSFSMPMSIAVVAPWPPLDKSTEHVRLPLEIKRAIVNLTRWPYSDPYCMRYLLHNFVMLGVHGDYAVLAALNSS